MFNSKSLIDTVTIGLMVWLGILSALLIRTITHYNRLTRGVTGAGLHDVLQELLKSLRSLQGRTEDIESKTEMLSRDGQSHHQRIGIVRFNPFADTGGAQSFTIAVLDAKNSGIVMTSLYARSGNRWYAKEVTRGEAKDLELSKEEKAAIDKAVSGGGKTNE